MTDASDATVQHAVTVAMELVPGINPSFLRDRLVVPLGLTDGALRWGVADPVDDETLAALRFVAQRPVTVIILPADTIRALLDPRRDTASASAWSVPVAAVPHAEAVVRLRFYLVEAMSVNADCVEIVAGTGLLVMRRGEDEVASHPLGTAEAKRLAAAAGALADGENARDAPQRFAITHDGRSVCVLVEPTATGLKLYVVSGDRP